MRNHHLLLEHNPARPLQHPKPPSLVCSIPSDDDLLHLDLSIPISTTEFSVICLLELVITQIVVPAQDLPMIVFISSDIYKTSYGNITDKKPHKVMGLLC